MTREQIDGVLRSVIPRPKYLEEIKSQLSSGRMPREEMNQMHSGTTIVAFKYSEGILFAGDRKTSGGGLSIIALDTKKIHPVSNYSIMGSAGDVGDIQLITDALHEVNEAFSDRYGFPISTLGQANFLRNTLRDFYYASQPLWLQTILGGYSMTGEFEIFEMWQDGGRREVQYTAIGSGTPGAKGILQENRNLINKKLRLEKAIRLALKAIYRASENDNGSSDLRVATPTIMVVTKNGVREIDQLRVQKSKNILVEELRSN